MRKTAFVCGAILLVICAFLRMHGYDLFMPSHSGFDPSQGFGFSKEGIRLSGILRLLEIGMGTGALVMVLAWHRGASRDEA
jgi:hypothetical protein